MKTTFVMLLALVLAACAPTQQSSGRSAPSDDAPSPAGTIPRAASTAGNVPAHDAVEVLTRHHWQLTRAKDKSGQRIDALFARRDKPLQLDFDARGISITNTCNGMRGDYSLSNGRMVIGDLASTLMACLDDDLMALDKAAATYLHGTLAFDLDASGSNPTLALTTAQGATLTFTGVPTAETRYGSKGDTVFLEVAPQAAVCAEAGAPDTHCLEVRALHYDANGIRSGQPGPWHTLDGAIEGYNHQAGVRNVLRVKRFEVANPPANASSVAYVLDMVVESELPPHE